MKKLFSLILFAYIPMRELRELFRNLSKINSRKAVSEAYSEEYHGLLVGKIRNDGLIGFFIGSILAGLSVIFLAIKTLITAIAGRMSLPFILFRIIIILILSGVFHNGLQEYHNLIWEADKAGWRAEMTRRKRLTERDEARRIQQDREEKERMAVEEARRRQREAATHATQQIVEPDPRNRPLPPAPPAPPAPLI